MAKTAAKKKDAKAKATEGSFVVIKSPVITEKSSRGSEFSQVTFNVPADATKPQIRQAVEGLWNVKVKSVNTVNTKGKVKRFQGRLGVRSDGKKAIVTLAEGQSIDVTSGV
ncbi:MAG: 50S ribosomal protein L23 [Alphaproteobacteria bacterium]|nr:50S ribosomal protein L23 [Alphaproteobacteria bacterium]